MQVTDILIATTIAVAPLAFIILSMKANKPVKQSPAEPPALEEEEEIVPIIAVAQVEKPLYRRVTTNNARSNGRAPGSQNKYGVNDPLWEISGVVECNDSEYPLTVRVRCSVKPDEKMMKGKLSSKFTSKYGAGVSAKSKSYRNLKAKRVE